jgi:hypothetical protein
MSVVISFPSREDDVRAAAAVVCAWLVDQGQQLSTRESLDMLASKAVPQGVLCAWQSILDSPVETAFAVTEVRFTIAESVNALSTAFANDRDAYVFWTRLLSPSITLEAIADTLGVTRERVRQVYVRAVKDIRNTLAKDECSVFRWRAHELCARLGIMAPSESSWVSDAISRAARGVPDDWVARLRPLLLWYAGPYEIRDGWLASGSGPRAQELITEFVDDTQRVNLEAVAARLSEAGLVAQAIMAWINQNIPTRVIGTGTYLWTGSVPDKAAILLEASGEPATAEDITERIGEGHDVRATRQRLLNDERFVRTDRNRLGLRSWQMEEYTGIADEIEQEIIKLGGEAKIAELADRLCVAFDVSPSSVYALADAPRFLVSDGKVRIRTSSEPFVVSERLTDCARCYLLDHSTCCFRIEVDRNVIRGSGRPIPAALGAWLGALPGYRRSYRFDDVEVTVSWPDSSIQGPSIGSIRRIAESFDLEPGDQLLLVFNRESLELRPRGLSQAELARLSPGERIARLAGIPGTWETAVQKFAAAVGAHDIHEICERLRQREEDDLLRLVPDNEKPADLDAALQRLGRLF